MSRLRQDVLRQRVAMICAVILMAMAGYVGTRKMIDNPHDSRSNSQPTLRFELSDSGDWSPAELDTVAELLIVFIGQSTCVHSRPVFAREAVQAAIESARAEAAQRGLRTAAVGISVDRDPERGARYLADIGIFTETFAGQGWENPAAAYFVRGYFSGQLATPQILVVERSHEGSEGLVLRQRVIGGGDINLWVKGGARILHPWSQMSEGIG